MAHGKRTKCYLKGDARLTVEALDLLLAEEVVSITFFFNAPATTKIYTSLHTLSLHDALPISPGGQRHRPDHQPDRPRGAQARRQGVRSEEHTSELQSRNDISYAVFCLKK